MKTKQNLGEKEASSDSVKATGQKAHTPIPWEASFTMVLDKEGIHIADTGVSYVLKDDEMECNAALIVKAVNCHADLLEALKRSYEVFRNERPSLDSWMPCNHT